MSIISNLTQFPKVINHCPKIFLIDAKNKILGRLATDISALLMGKNSSFYTPNINQSNFVIILNSQLIKVSGNKETQKKYYKNSQRPGSLKTETLKNLRKRIPARILEKAVWGMLPKSRLGRMMFKNLYIYKNSEICYKKNRKSLLFIENFLKKNLIKYD